MVIEKLYERDLHLGTRSPLCIWVLHYNVTTHNNEYKLG